MSKADEIIDPFEAHFHRDPLPDAGVRVVVIADGDLQKAEHVAESLAALLAEKGRTAEKVVVPLEGGWNRTWENALAGASLPLVLVTTAVEPWTAAHLDPLLTSINECDISLGCRRASLGVRIKRWLAMRPWRFIFALPLHDVHTPCRLFRLE